MSNSDRDPIGCILGLIAAVVVAIPTILRILRFIHNLMN